MNQRTELNSELLSADARGRKHIPFAVFAVILIHIVLFVMLLIAAGCRSSARAKAGRPMPERTQEPHPAEKYLQAATNAAPVESLVSTEPILATEPVVDPEPVAARPLARPEVAASVVTPGPAKQVRSGHTRSASRFTAQQASAKPAITRPPGIYVVQAGDTVERIARRHGTSIEAIKTANKLKGHTIFPGQKLVVKPGSASSTAQVKKPKSSNEV